MGVFAVGSCLSALIPSDSIGMEADRRVGWPDVEPGAYFRIGAGQQVLVVIHGGGESMPVQVALHQTMSKALDFGVSLSPSVPPSS